MSALLKRWRLVREIRRQSGPSLRQHPTVHLLALGGEDYVLRPTIQVRGRRFAHWLAVVLHVLFGGIK